MKRKINLNLFMPFLFLMIFFFPAFTALAASVNLSWDLPVDSGIIDGYIVYFNESAEIDTPHSKNILKTDLITDETAGTVTYEGFAAKCNLQNGTAYDVYLTAYNAYGESDPSNTVNFTMPPWTPPADHLPDTVINIPSGIITIQIGKME